MEKITSIIELSNLTSRSLTYEQSNLSFIEDGTLFFDPWDTRPYPFPWLRPKVSICRSPGNTRTENALYFSLDRLHFKRSIGSSIVSERVMAKLRRAVVTSGMVNFSKPKRPVYHDLKFFGREPVYRPVDERKFPMPKQGKVKDSKWLMLQHKYLGQRSYLIDRINQARHKLFLKKKSAYDKRYADYQRRQQEHMLIHLKRVEKYKRRVIAYEAAISRAVKRSLKLLPQQRGLFTEQHPYTEIALRGSDQSQNFAMYLWNSAGNTIAPNITNACLTAGNIDLIQNAGATKGSLGTFADDFYSAFSLMLEEYEGLLVRKLYDQVANQKTHFGNLVAERKQTLEMIATNYQRVYKLIKLKRSVLSAVGSYVTDKKAWANDVLAFKFGVEPLVKDISQGIDFLNDSDSSPLVVHANAAKRFEGFSINNDILDFSGYVEIRYSSTWDAANDISRLTSQFGLTDPSQIAWEVTPWSFVVDWFLPVGAWIQAQTADCGLTWSYGSKSIRAVGDFNIKDPTFRSLNRPPSPYDRVSFGGPVSGFVKYRRPILQLPSSNRILYVKSPWSWSHAVEAAALTAQRLK